MIMSPKYAEWARRWLTSAGLDASQASAEEMAPVVEKAYPGGWRQLKKDADGWAAHDERVSCYMGRGEGGRSEAVHERRSDGSCACGSYKTRA